MSFSGTGLYDDDTGADVRSRFRELVADGVPASQATDALEAEWGDALDDHDEACAFWLALADTQSRVGRLDDRVRDRAMGIIDSGEDLSRFEHDATLRKRRRKVLADLAARLAAPQRKPARIRRPFRSVSPVGLGDVFSCELEGGRRVYMRAVEIVGDERDNAPTVEVLDWIGDGPPPEPAALPALPSLPRPASVDLMRLVRNPRDPDPADRIVILTPGAPITREETLPAAIVPWVELEDALERHFGLRREQP